MARFSLFILPMTFTAGCFDAPPEYSEPTLVPPVIFADQVKPSTTELYSPTGDANFTIVFRADDGDRPLKLRLAIDISLSPVERALDELTLTPDPRAFADQTPPRSMDWSWQWSLDSRNVGCHVVTAIITDADNFASLVTTRDPFAAAQVSWYVYLRPLNDERPAEDVTCFGEKGAGVTR